MYKFEYVPETIWLINSLDAKQTKLKNSENDTLDKYICTICEDHEHGFMSDLFYSKNADTKICLDRKFFENGPKWKYDKNVISQNGAWSTKMKNICVENNAGRVFVDAVLT